MKVDIGEVLPTRFSEVASRSLGCQGRQPLNNASALTEGDSILNADSNEPPPATADPAQFLRLFLENERRIYAFIVSILPNLADAEDVLQETSLLLWQKFDQFQPGTDFVAWACRFAQFRVLKFYDKQGRSRLRFEIKAIEAIAKEALTMGSMLEARHEALAKCLEVLTARDRDLLQRRYADDFSPLQISQQVGRSIHAIYKAFSRIHEVLLACIQRRLEREREQTP